MPYYKVKNKWIPIEDDPGGTKIRVPDVDVEFRIMRYCRKHDGCFIVETKVPPKEFEEEVGADNVVAKLRFAWWDKNEKDRAAQSTFHVNPKAVN